MIRMKRFMAGLMVFTMLAGCGATPALAYTGGEAADTETEEVSEAASEATEETSPVIVRDAETDAADQDGETETDQPYSVTIGEDGTLIITCNGEEISIGSDEDAKDGSIGTGTVVNVNSYLNLRDGAGMGANVIGHLLSGTEVTVLGEDGDWYEVSIPEQNGYVSKKYLDVVLNESDGSEMSSEMMTLLMLMMMQGLNTGTDSTGLTPDGNLTLVDDIGSSAGSGQQFITLTTKAGNVFYLVIDRDDDGDENVHFLNLVDEADLFALLDEDAQAAYTAEKESGDEEQAGDQEETATASDTEDPEETEAETVAKSGNPNWAPLMLLVIVMAGAVGAFLYLAVKKKKKQKETAMPDPDADYEDDTEYDIPEDEDTDEDDSGEVPQDYDDGSDSEGYDTSEEYDEEPEEDEPV